MMRRNGRAAILRRMAAYFGVMATPMLAEAQGTLSTQGLGFPPGQLSTAARTMGGATGETDPLSPLNPAAIGLLRSPIIFMQAEPEFRELRVGGRLQRTSVTRFPVFVGAMALGSRWTVSAAASTLLDRTWATTTRDTQFVGNDTLGAGVLQRSDGSIADLRLAVAFATTPWLRIGIGGHAYSGRDFLQTVRAFDDSTRFSRDTQSTTLSFGGNAISLGAHAVWAKVGAAGLTFRKGGSMQLYSEGRLVQSATAPDHLGVSLVYLGIRGTSLAVRAASDRWSGLQEISPSLNIHDGLDVGVGAEVPGPRFGGNALSLRAGGRWRTLPFSVNATAVKEQTWSGGFGLPLANNRVELNLGALRSSRTGDAGVTENAWTISTGFAVRP